MEGKLNTLAGTTEEKRLKKFVGSPELENYPETRKLLQVLGNMPELEDVGIEFITPEDEELTAGYHSLIEGKDGYIRSTVFIGIEQLEHVQGLLKTREDSARIAAELLGIKFEDMNPKILLFFIIAHEFGHARDFTLNYASKEAPKEARIEWREHYDAVLHSLPVPGFDPVDLREEIGLFDNLDEVVEVFPMLRNYSRFNELKSIKDLLKHQEEAYRNSPYEKYADGFAAKILKANAQVLGLGQLLVEKNKIDIAA